MPSRSFIAFLPDILPKLTNVLNRDMKPNCLAALSLFLFASFSYAETANEPKPKIYKYRVGSVTTFSDIAPTKSSYVVVNLSCFACNPLSTIDWQATKLYRTEFSDAIERAAERYGIDAALVRAVIHAESGFNARARSRKGAIGLMQLMPATAREVGVIDASIPAQNIRGGAQYLAGLLEQFKNDMTLATAAYNAGPGAVEKYSGVPPYAETQAYVKRVNILHQRYRSKDRE
jgi:soluble lytic murein transglycosylase-like protein